MLAEKSSTYCALALIAVLCLLSPAIYSAEDSAGAVAAEIRTLLDQRRPQDAFALAERGLARHGGDPEFDFSYALAALDAGRSQQAVYALERVLLADAANTRARLELGRAYFLSEHLDRAREAFEAVSALSPPARVQAHIDRYQRAIDRRQRSQRSRLSGFLELQLGGDSNVNSATAADHIEIPALGTVELAADAQPVSDRFAAKRAGLRWIHPLSRRLDIDSALHVQDRENFTTETSDLRMLHLSSGPSLNLGTLTLQVPAQGQLLYLNNRPYRRLAGLGVNADRKLGANDRLGAGALISTLRYAQAGDTRDADSALVSLQWSRSLPGSATMVSARLFAGHERARTDSGNHNGKNYKGLRLGWHSRHLAQHRPYLNLTLQHSQYAGEHPVFLEHRRDRFLDARAGWEWQATTDWTLQLGLSFTDNDSNLDIYTYRRRQAFVGIRRHFE